jgi:hypothetical protein
VFPALAALGSLVFLIALLAPQGFDPSALINVGTTLSDAAALPPLLNVVRDGDGYDGQFAYRLALNPLTSERTLDGLTLDLPAYRQQRLLYPALAWASAFGQATLVPFTLPLVNVVAIAVLTWLTALFAGIHGRGALLSIAVAALPAFAIALANDLGEIVLAAALVGGAVALERKRPVLVAVWLSLAALAHEHGVLLVLAVAIVTVAAPELRTRGWVWTWLLPLAIFVGWQIYLNLVWGETPIRVAIGYLNQPLRGFLSVARGMIPPRSLSDVLHLCGFAYALLLSGGCVWALRTTETHRGVCLGWVFASGLLFLGTGVVWATELTFWRAATAPVILGSLVLIGSRARIVPPLMILGGAFGLLMGARLVWIAWRL